MSQRRMGLVLGGVVLAVAAISVPAYAQGQQRGEGAAKGAPAAKGDSEAVPVVVVLEVEAALAAVRSSI